MTLDLSDYPVQALHAIKMACVMANDFEKAAMVRDVQKLAIQINEMIQPQKS